MEYGNTYLAFVLGTLIFTMFAFSLIVFLIHYKRKQQMHITEKLHLLHRYEQELLRSRLEVQEQSFQYFSEEIHDNVGAVLTVCKMHLHQLSSNCTDDQSAELITQSTEMLTKALTDLRSISHTLNGNFIGRAGLREALEKELRYIASSRKIAARVEIEGDLVLLPQEKELLIFRIIQEAISNALKHAAPQQVLVRLRYEPGSFTVTVFDDGSGFDPSLGNTAGLGLTNMQIRATLLDGTISFDSAKDRGTVVKLQINLSDEHPASHAHSPS